MVKKEPTIEEQLLENRRLQLQALNDVGLAKAQIDLIVEDQKTFFSRVLMFFGFKKDALPAAQDHLQKMEDTLKTVKNAGIELNNMSNAAKAMVEETSALASKISSGVSSTFSKGMDWVNRATGITGQSKQLEEITEKLRENVAKRSSPPPPEPESFSSKILTSLSYKQKPNIQTPNQPTVDQEQQSTFKGPKV